MRAGTTTSIVGFVSGLAVILAVGGLWLSVGPPPAWPSAVRAALVERRGAEVYNANCLACHGGPTGGAIADSPPPHNANGHTWHHPDCAIKTMIREGSAGIFEVRAPESPRMQPFKDKLSADDIDALVAYIKTMWAPWQRDVQATFTRDMCYESNS